MLKKSNFIEIKDSLGLYLINSPSLKSYWWGYKGSVKYYSKISKNIFAVGI